MKKWVPVSAFALAASTGAQVGWASPPAAVDAGVVVVRLQGDLVSSPHTVSPPTCDPSGVNCVFTMASSNTWTGGLEGISEASGSATVSFSTAMASFAAFDPPLRSRCRSGASRLQFFAGSDTKRSRDIRGTLRITAARLAAGERVLRR